MTGIIGDILSICGGVSIIGGAFVMIWKFIRPAFKLAQRVSKLEELTEKDYRALQKLDVLNREEARCTLILMNHVIDGNHIDKIKETRDRLQDVMIE